MTIRTVDDALAHAEAEMDAAVLTCAARMRTLLLKSADGVWRSREEVEAEVVGYVELARGQYAQILDTLRPQFEASFASFRES